MILGETERTVVYPPNGIIPFHGFSFYLAPLCFIWSDPVTIYMVFKEMYTRFFFRLHSVSSHPQGSTFSNFILFFFLLSHFYFPNFFTVTLSVCLSLCVSLSVCLSLSLLAPVCFSLFFRSLSLKGVVYWKISCFWFLILYAISRVTSKI